MKYYLFDNVESAEICILTTTINSIEIKKAYLDIVNINPSSTLILDLFLPIGKKKASVKEMKAYIHEELEPEFTDYKVKYIVCTDAEYFKVLTGQPKADANLGYVFEIANRKIIYTPSYKAIFYNPERVKSMINQAMSALVADRVGKYVKPGSKIIKFAEYPNKYEQIWQWLNRLTEMNVPLTCDIEAFSLKHYKAGIATIAFAWNQEEGIAFTVDYVPFPNVSEAPFGTRNTNNIVRALLIDFFKNFKQKIIYHNIAYDAYVLIYQLFMNDICDTNGLLYGIETMLSNWEDTKLISYLATNSCAGNKLSLKDQAQEFAGNYAQSEIKNVLNIPLDELLQYNLIDALSTWYVYNKHYQTMINDQQLDIYQNLFKPATIDIIQMQLTGMPVNMSKVHEIKQEMQADYDNAGQTINSSLLVQEFTQQLNQEWVDTKNSTYKKKRVSLVDAHEMFNPNSGLQLQKLLFQQLGLPVLGLTDTKQPSTDGDTLKALRNHTTDPNVLSLLNALIDYKAVDKILNTFIPVMEDAVECDGWHYLFGNFNLGGTVSGRLSSSEPNLQNLPSNSKYGKLIKSAFQAPSGWLFVGLDFASLEDRISALTTKDPNKLKVYADGYDGHSLRAFNYYKEQLPDIQETVESINSIEKKYKHFRQESKAPTFALTYQGTYITLMNNCGFSEEKAKLIEKRYHELYAASDRWIQSKLDQASRDGYITAAFGLRVRTPLLYQVIRGNSKTPFEAEAEGRTAGNALGQSWCLLNVRALKAFMQTVRTSKFNTSIRPSASIHDANYFIIKDDLETLMFLNKHLVEEVNWNKHPDIYHPQVGLGGDLSVFYPSWREEISIPNNATASEITAIVDKTLSKS